MPEFDNVPVCIFGPFCDVDIPPEDWLLGGNRGGPIESVVGVPGIIACDCGVRGGACEFVGVLTGRFAGLAG